MNFGSRKRLLTQVFHLSRVALTLSLILGLSFQGCAHRATTSEAQDEAVSQAEEAQVSETVGEGEPVEETPTEVTETDLPFAGKYHWTMPESDLPIVVNKHVYAWMNYFTGRGREIFAKWLIRKGQVDTMMVRVLEEYQLPKDMVYLAMIESGFNPRAYSRAKASGPWQFIRRTGERYGLQVNYWVDERRDPEKSTEAAARHLHDLYEDFGDWYLVAAAYNAGAGKVNRAIQRHGTRDFWELIEARRPYLRAETRNYVPKLLAALIIAKQPAAFGFDMPTSDPERETDSVEIDDAVDLRVIARCAETDTEEIAQLNPELVHWFTPPERPDYLLRLPPGTRDKFLKAYADIPQEDRITFRHHVLGRGETLGHVATKYHTTIGAIMELNKISSPKRVRTGKLLFIPIRREESAQFAEAKDYSEGTHKRRHHRTAKSGAGGRVAAQKSIANASVAPPKNSRAVHHVVQQGDTLWAISMKYDVPIRSLKKWNSIRRAHALRPGDVLTIYVKDA